MTIDRHWQPIETAPKDGTNILLYFPRLRSDIQRIVGHWGKPMFGKECWFDPSGLKSLSYGNAYDPTHWIPLPAKPEPTEGPTP
jgi:hypothetical protein